MLVLLMQFLSGYLHIRVEGGSPERFLNLCSHHHIYIWDLRPCGNAYALHIGVRGFRHLRPLLKKSGARVRILERKGLPFFLHKYRRRKLFFGGMACCVLFLYLMSLFIWDIRIEGNRARTDEVIRRFLESKQVACGMLRAKVDCGRIVKDIRREYDDIIWVSAYVRGNCLLIRVKENTDRKEAGETTPSSGQAEARRAGASPVDLVAEKDGVIRSIITRAGVPLVHAGDTVKKGDVLVRGAVEVVNDAGEVTGYHYRHADADIIAETTEDYEDVLPLTYKVRMTTGRKRFFLRLEGKKKVYTIGADLRGFSTFTEESARVIPRIGNHISLPFVWGCGIVRECRIQEKTYSREAYREILSTNFQRFCGELEKKGVQILENNVKIYKETGRAAARGTLRLAEPIGIEQEGNLTYGNSGDSD